MKNQTATLNKLKQVIETVTGNPVGDIDMKGDIKSQLSLDSMQFVQLFSALEIELNVELPLSIMNVTKVEDFISILQETADIVNQH